MNNEQFQKNPSPREQYRQMSIFDVLPEEHWGDAKPQDYAPTISPNQQALEDEERRANIERIRAKIKKKKREEDIERTCVWCGEVIEGPLDEHEDECSS